MNGGFGICCVSLIFCAALSETIGVVVAAKEKRGWTLNSAGYLLGPHVVPQTSSLRRRPSDVVPQCVDACGCVRVLPVDIQDIQGRIDHLIQIKDSPRSRGRDELPAPYGIDGHRTLGDKSGLAGKRDAAQEEDVRTGALRIADGDVIHTLLDFLSYLKLKDMGALDSLPSSVTSEELNP